MVRITSPSLLSHDWILRLPLAALPPPKIYSPCCGESTPSLAPRMDEQPGYWIAIDRFLDDAVPPVSAA